MKFNPRSLENMRNYRGYSQTMLASLVQKSGIKGVNQSSISKFEKGELEPSLDVINSIAKILEFPAKAFYRKLNNISIISSHAYRKNTSIRQKELRKLHAEMEIKAYYQQEISHRIKLKSFNYSENFKNLTPKEAAKIFRDISGEKSNTPINNLTKLIESLGIDVFLIDTNVDGVTINCGENYRAIFIGKHQSGDRYRFSLAHELGHYLLHGDCIDDSTKEMEDEANEFAAELLMPEAGIKDVLKTTNLNDYASLKTEWKVSMAALIFRAKSLGCINKNQSTELWKKMSFKGYRKQEPVSIEKEKPTRINQSLFDFSQKAPSKKINELLNLSRDDFISFYPNYEDFDDDYIDWLI